MKRTLAFLAGLSGLVLAGQAAAQSAVGAPVYAPAGYVPAQAIYCADASGKAQLCAFGGGGGGSSAATSRASYTGAAVVGGLDVALSAGSLSNPGTGAKLASGEITHSSPKAFSSGSVSWTFNARGRGPRAVTRSTVEVGGAGGRPSGVGVGTSGYSSGMSIPQPPVTADPDAPAGWSALGPEESASGSWPPRPGSSPPTAWRRR